MPLTSACKLMRPGVCRVAEAEARLGTLQAEVQAKVAVVLTHLDGLAKREARHAQRRGEHLHGLLAFSAQGERVHAPVPIKRPPPPSLRCCARFSHLTEETRADLLQLP